MRTFSNCFLEKEGIVEQMFHMIDCSLEVLDVILPHSWRVMYMAHQLGICLEIEDNSRLTLAALLHDIGKLGISREILFKPNKLTATEYTIIKSHSHIGNVIVRNIFNLDKAAVFIRDHHERWDGLGYPRGLMGENISLEGRIIGVVDSFDAMVFEKRNYAKNKSIDMAFKEFKVNSWSQFDGKIAQKFMGLWEEKILSREIITEVDAVINNWLKSVYQVPNTKNTNTG